MVNLLFLGVPLLHSFIPYITMLNLQSSCSLSFLDLLAEAAGCVALLVMGSLGALEVFCEAVWFVGSCQVSALVQ